MGVGSLKKKKRRNRNNVKDIYNIVCFSNLSRLGLIGVVLPNEHSTQRLFSGCPMLEDLKLENCDWGYVKAAVSVVSPRLRCFTMIEDQLQDLGDEVHITFGSLYFDVILVKDRFFKLLSYSSNVPILGLANASCLDSPEVIIHMPVFNGVRRLELDCGSTDLSNRGLLKVLQNMPCLESLAFLQGIKMPSDLIEDNILNPLPPCFSSTTFILFPCS